MYVDHGHKCLDDGYVLQWIDIDYYICPHCEERYSEIGDTVEKAIHGNLRYVNK